MLCARIGLAQRYINGLIQTRCQLICQTINFICRITTSIWNVQIWKYIVNVSACFCSIWIGTKHSNDRHLYQYNQNNCLSTHPKKSNILQHKTKSEYSMIVAYLFYGIGTKFRIASVQTKHGCTHIIINWNNSQWKYLRIIGIGCTHIAFDINTWSQTRFDSLIHTRSLVHQHTLAQFMHRNFTTHENRMNCCCCCSFFVYHKMFSIRKEKKINVTVIRLVHQLSLCLCILQWSKQKKSHKQRICVERI